MTPTGHRAEAEALLLGTENSECSSLKEFRSLLNHSLPQQHFSLVHAKLCGALPLVLVSLESNEI